MKGQKDFKKLQAVGWESRDMKLLMDPQHRHWDLEVLNKKSDQRSKQAWQATDARIQNFLKELGAYLEEAGEFLAYLTIQFWFLKILLVF